MRGGICELSGHRLKETSHVTNNPATYRDPSGHARSVNLDLAFGPNKTPDYGRPPDRVTWEPEYCDFNVTAGSILVVTGGLMWDDAGAHLYYGFGIGTGPLGAAITCSNDSITPGRNWGVQGTAIVSFQRGATLQATDDYSELGLGWPLGASATVFWVSDRLR
jgi:hypothetical protein